MGAVRQAHMAEELSHMEAEVEEEEETARRWVASEPPVLDHVRVVLPVVRLPDGSWPFVTSTDELRRGIWIMPRGALAPRPPGE